LIRNSAYNYGTTTSDIYKTYMGVNKIIVGDAGEKPLTVNASDVNVYTQLLWQKYVVSAT
jgi:phosphatidate phosphatase APP1